MKPLSYGKERYASMLDFSQITDTISGWFSSADGLHNGLGDALSNAGLDPAILENLPVDQLTETLSAAGIDPSSLSESQLGELVQNVQDGAAGGFDISDLLNGWGK